MRTLTSNMLDALGRTSYRLRISATLEPSRVYFDSLEASYAPGWADAIGVPDSPVIQEIGISSPATSYTLVTFYNYGGTLQYQVAGSATLTNTSVSIDGKPGVFGDHIFYMSGSNLYHQVLDWSAILSHSSSIFSSGGSIFSGYAGGIAVAVHGISATECMVFEEEEGGFRVHYHDTSSNQFNQPGRFMFPKLFQYYDEDKGESERAMSDLVLSSGASKLGNECFAYISNCVTGSVEGILFSTTSEQFSDIFIAVPSELSSSMSEFRATNAFTYGSAVYMSGQFIRRDNATDFTPYVMVLKSTNGRNFSMDRLTMVSAEGYRALAMVANDDFYLTACNRTGSTDATFYFLGTDNEAAGIARDIYGAEIDSFSDTSVVNAAMQVKAGDHALMFHEYMVAGSRMLVDVGYDTQGGIEELRYGSYIIEGFQGAVAQGFRSLSPRLVNESQFNLSSMSSPFYTQIISKSSIKDDLVDLKNMYVAPGSGLGETRFSVDFWGCEAYDNTDEGITGLSPTLKGGVGVWVLNGSHKIGAKTKDLDTLFSVSKLPEFSATSAHFDIYGWSFDRDGSSVDYVGLLLFCQSSGSAGDYVRVVDNTKQFPCTYLNSASGDYPIGYDVNDLVVGDKLQAIGVYYEAAGDTESYIQRVDITSGVTFYRDTFSDNTPWIETTGGGLEIPGTLSPRIMFSSKPYNAYNFRLRANFRSTLSGYVSSLASGFGLVGLAEDGGNYIVGRYNLANSLLEIVKVRDRQETVLTSGSPGEAISEYTDMLFSHHDGRFSISIYRNNTWEEDLYYEWQATDEWMFTDNVASMHTGIYGLIGMPYFYTTGLDVGAEEDNNNSDAIPFMPGLSVDQLDLFPSSGTVVVDDNKYTYSGKYKPSEIRGPSQFRNNGDGTGGTYADPYGNGQPGLECLDFDWLKSDGSYTGYVIAIKDGGSYMCTDTQWQIWNTTGGVRKDIPDRARYSAEDTLIAKVYYDLSYGVYLTGGLLSPELKEGEAGIHLGGTRVELDHSGSIWCMSFEGSSGDSDVTVEDLIDRISRNCNAVAEFPGDIEYASLTYSGSDLTLASQEDVPGFDVRFTFPVLTNGDTFDIESDTQARGYDSDTKTYIQLKRISSGSYSVSFYTSPSDTLIDSRTFEISDLPHSMRVLYHDNFATVYIDESWIHTFAFTPYKNDEDPANDIPGITYGDALDIVLRSNHSGLVFSNIRVCELADWREAVYIDLDTDGQSAIQSIIQERPVSIWHKSNGAIAYSYDPERSTITPDSGLISRHEFTNSFPQNAGSDGIVYFTDVRTIQNLDFAALFGLITKIVRLPSLDQGAVKAAKLILKRDLEQNENHTITMRPDLRVEVGDLMRIMYTSTGAVKAFDVTIEVENISIQINPSGSNSMTIEGRIQI